MYMQYYLVSMYYVWWLVGGIHYTAKHQYSSYISLRWSLELAIACQYYIYDIGKL